MNDLAFKLLDEKHQIEKILIKENRSYNELLEDQFSSKELMVDINDANDILYNDEITDGIYGFLNYQFDLKHNKMLDRNYEINNKKIKKEQLEGLMEQNYGVLDLFSKKDNIITALNKSHFVKDGNINIINNTNYNKIEIDKLDDGFIMTKVYKIEKNKINLLFEMTKQEYIVEDEISKKIKEYDNKMKQMCLKNKNLLEYAFDFENIEKLRKIMSLNENQLDVEDVMMFDYSKIINNFKISNRYEKTDYDNLIKKHYGSTYDDIYNGLIVKYNIKKKIVNDALKIVLETLMRIFVDIKLNHKTYCLNKVAANNIPQTIDVNLDVSSNALINRYCKKVLLEKSNDVVVIIYQLLKKHDLSYIVSYLDGL